MEEEGEEVEVIVSIDAELKDALQQAFDKGYQAGIKAARQRIKNTLLSINGPTPPPAYRVSVDELDLRERVRQCLKRSQLNTIGDIVDFHNHNLEAGGLLVLPNFGNTSYEEVFHSLDERGVVLKES
jgi:DNA-directed RNA polymerase alpha subunit